MYTVKSVFRKAAGVEVLKLSSFIFPVKCAHKYLTIDVCLKFFWPFSKHFWSRATINELEKKKRNLLPISKS